MKRIVCALALVLCLYRPGPVVADEVLSINPVMQNTPVWCWAAVASMVFEHLGYPSVNRYDYQCGVVALLHPACNFNCFNCITAIGANQNFIQVLKGYPRAITGENIRVRLQSSALSADKVVEWIDDGNPIIAGISPGLPVNLRNPHGAQHVALIIGYEGDPSNLTLIVNDPMPYLQAGVPNPYLAAGASEIETGQYSIRYQSFRNLLGWHVSFFDFNAN